MKGKLKIVIGIALIPVIIFLWPAFLGGDAEFLLVQGTSMLPTIEPGSFVITKQKESYEVDDVVSYSTSITGPFGGRNIVHRIIEKTDEGFIIKGDNNKRADPGIVSPDVIRGEVILFTPFLGYVLIIMRNPLVMGVFAILMLLFQFKKKKKKEKSGRGIKGKLELEIEKKPKKKKNKNYVLFVPALVINLLSYVIIQLSIEAGINRPNADPITSFLFSVTDSYLASTASFGLYFLLILGLYYWAKNHDVIPRMVLPTGGVITLKKKTDPVLALSRIVWLLLIISGSIFLILMFQELRSELY
ncbi:MAG: signal peptidase I [Thaumarchaeota archaeon]|nr:signal peptidase I [Nitrososphaerota archaeon]